MECQSLGIIALVIGSESGEIELVCPLLRREENGVGNLVGPPSEIIGVNQPTATLGRGSISWCRAICPSQSPDKAPFILGVERVGYTIDDEGYRARLVRQVLLRQIGHVRLIACRGIRRPEAIAESWIEPVNDLGALNSKDDRRDCHRRKGLVSWENQIDFSDAQASCIGRPQGRHQAEGDSTRFDAEHNENFSTLLLRRRKMEV